MTGDERIYWLTAVDGRGNVREYDCSEDRSVVIAEKAEIERKHPNWIVRVKTR